MQLASSRRPAIASHGYTAIQRYTLYSYTALYSIHAIHHPSACTLLMLPRPGYEAPERRPFCVALRPGDVYVLRDTARWEWLHGVAVADDVEVARRAVVWRVLVD